MTTERRYKAPALKKGLEILELLASASEPLSTPEISAALDRSTSEIYRMLQVLEELRYISREEGGFSLTNRLLSLSMGRPSVRDLLAAALPAMHTVARATGQSCHLAVESGAEMVVIAGVEAPGLSGFAVRAGYRRPLHHSASGRILLAFQSAEGRQTMFDEIFRMGETINIDELSTSLDAIVEDGGSMTPSPVLTGITDLSNPICVAGVARAALTVPFVDGPSARVTLTAARSVLRVATDNIVDKIVSVALAAAH